MGQVFGHDEPGLRPRRARSSASTSQVFGLVAFDDCIFVRPDVVYDKYVC